MSMKIKLNYARQLWLSLLLLVGVAAIAVPGLNGTNSGGVAKIGSTEYATLQEAVDAAYADMTGDVTIELIADISANTVVRQNSGLNLTITGGEKLSTAKTITGQILIDGVGNYGSDVLTIQYIKFTGNKTDFVSGKDAFIAVPSPQTLPSPYTANRLSDGHNITITDCSFTSTSSSLDVVGFKSEANANVRDLTISNCTGTNLHSFAQLQGTTNATFTKCTANSSGSFVGVNGGGGDYVFSGCKLPSSKDGGYAIRVKESSAASVTLSSNTFTATDAIILNTSKGSILVESGTYNGNITKSNGTLKISGGDFISGSDISTYFSDYSPATNQEINGQWVTTDKAFMVTKADGTISFSDSKTLSSAGTYKLLKDYEMYRIGLTSNMANFTIDLNGHTLSQVSGYTDWPLIYATKSIAVGEINILDTSAGKGGKIIANAGGNAVAAISIGKQVSNTIVNIGEGVTIQGNTVLIEGANNTLNVNGTINGGDEFAVCTNGSTTTNATININEGAALTSNATAMYLPGNNGLKATVNGGTITGGDSGIEVRAGELTVNGGTITATASEYSYAPNGSGTTVKGAAIAVSQHGTLLPTTANVNGGTLTGTKTIAVVAHEQNTSLENVTVVAKDEFVANNTEIPAGFKWVSSEGMSTLTPCDYVAQVGETKYETLADAFAAAADGNTITLLTNVELTDRLFVNAGATPEYNGTDKRFATTSENKSITLELNGYNVTTSSNIALAGGSLNIVNSGTADATHGVISTSASGLAPIEIRGTGDPTQKRTLTIGTGVTLSGAEYGLNVFGSNDAQKNVIEVNVNGTVEGTLFVLGNLSNTDNNIVVNVNSGASLKGKVGIALNGFATVNVADNTTIEGTDLGIEVRAGNLNVAGGTITSTATEYKVESNGSGTTTTGAAIAVAQHTTGLPINANITGCTLSGVKTISVADPENGNLAGVTVKVADALANAETVIIPVAYEWVSDGTMSTLTPRDPVAKIEETVYYSLADAVAAVPTDGTEKTITLLADVTENVAVSGGKNIVLDLGEKTLTGYIDLYDSELNVKNGNIAGTVYVNGGPASAESGYNKFTLASDANITADYGIILYQAEGTTVGYGSTIDINGTVNGMVWVMGNITKGNSIINVNSGASIKGDVGVALNGLATVNVAANTTIEGAEVGIEARAGNLNVEGGTITSTATEYKVESNGSGTTTTGAAIAVAQHTTGLPINANITGGTLSGVKTISVADPEGGNYAGVVVTAKDELTEGEVVIPDGYIWISNNDGTSTLTKAEDGEYVLIDGEDYPFMNLKSDISVPEVTYKRTFSSDNVNKHQPWFVPMDYTITDDDVANFTFYKLHMVAGAAVPGEADANSIYLYVTPMNVGDVLQGNRPYTVKPKNAVSDYEFKAEDTKLYAPNTGSRLNVTTSSNSYDFYGKYVGESYSGNVGDMYYLSSGSLHPNKETTTFRPYRWIIKVTKNDTNGGYSKVEFSIVEDGDATGIDSSRIINSDEVEGIYTTNGMKVDEPVRGINIIRYKNGKTEKIIVK